ncbi:MAG: hypothetical protein GWP06_06955 [Actinobacteria bacterium]|nr:hypothetical protein [Actinomycetota bacterium]
MLKNRKSFVILITVTGIFLFISFFGCSKNSPSYKLKVTPFALNIPNVNVDKYFGRVTDVDITSKNEIIVVDVDGGVLRFDSNGKFVNNIVGYGSGNYDAICSAAPAGSLLAVNTVGLIEFFTRAGKPVKRFFIRGRGDVAVAQNGSFLINRMYDSFRLGKCLETYDEEGKLINKFRTPRCTRKGEEILDFSFSGITSDNKIIYMPATIDSGFIYDFKGNLVLAKKVNSKLKPYKLKDGTPGALIEDAYVSDEGIFVVRVKRKMSTEKIVFFDLIEQYDFNFDLVASYHFAKPLTMTVPTEPYSPWYHNFCYKDDVFYFMISQPFEQLIAFKVDK